MGGLQPARRDPVRRSAEFGALAVTLLATFAAGVWLGPRLTDWSGLRRPESADTRPAAAPGHDPSKGIPDPAAPPPEDPRGPEPRAVEARKQVIERDTRAIREECQRAAGGDWEKWLRDTAPARAALGVRIDSLRDRPHPPDALPESTYDALEGREGFPLFEVGARQRLRYLVDPGLLEGFRRDRPVVAAQRWLRERGIDLIFIPVPKMAEVYAEHFADPCPADGIVAPHVRRALLELLEADVEVVDGFSLFRARRDADAEYLYNASDGHWAPRAMRIMAKEVADRVERYNFGTRARFGLPIVRTAPGPYKFRDVFGGSEQFGRDVLSPDQAARAALAQTTSQAEVRTQDGRRPPANPDSPVVLIGHSFAWEFREQLIKELNLLIESRVTPDQTTEAFADFLRDPASLAHCRVLVWVSTEDHMTRFKPLPGPIADALNSPGGKPR